MKSAAQPHASSTPKQLIVRLRNWVGDVVLGIPLLRLLESQGYQLHLIGKPWAKHLLLGEGWNVQSLAADWRARTTQLRELKHICLQTDPSFKHNLNALALPFSFSSALEMRLAGLRSAGYAHEGRGVLLSRPIKRPAGLHELQAYWHLASPFLPPNSSLPPPPSSIDYVVAPQDEVAAQALLAAHRVAPGYIVLCPFAGGTFSKKPKTWPHFERLAQDLVQQRKQVLLCPGPGESDEARRLYPGCTVLDGVQLGTYAALLKHAALMVSNDTGPGHLAAAVGVDTLSVLGPTDAKQWGAWGSNVTTVQGSDNSWPRLEEVSATLHQICQNTSGNSLRTHLP
ncbi:MAG: glycosyltransferase family 9 protein [Burkholderiales bacterium]